MIFTFRKEDKNQRDKLQSQIRHLQSEKTQLAAEKQKVEDLVDEYKKVGIFISWHSQSFFSKLRKSVFWHGIIKNYNKITLKVPYFTNISHIP